MTNKIDISKIAEEAAAKALANNSGRKVVTSYENKSYIKGQENCARKPYYYERFYNLTSEAKHSLNGAYIIRKEPFTDKRWNVLFEEFTSATKKEHFTGKSDDLKTFVTMAIFYAEHYKTGNKAWQKESKSPRFDSLKQYTEHEIRKLTDIEYEY